MSLHPAPHPPTTSFSDLDAFIARAGFPTPIVGCHALKGDASNRSYSRIGLAPGHVPASLILMQLAEPEAFKHSEEAVSAHDLQVTEIPFINIQRYLQSRGLGVPHIYGYDEHKGRILLEDLGDITLWDVVSGGIPGSLPTKSFPPSESLYRLAIEELVRLQTPGPGADADRCVAFGRRFDRALFVWELDHFLEYGIEARNEAVLEPAQREAIRAAFAEVADELAAAPQVLVHRDYHSKNLMLTGGRVRIIDFQDALMGPRSYDLASLLRDSYVSLEERMVDRLVAHYLDQAPGPRQSLDAFRRLFDLTSLQRNFKAAGRFVYIHVVKGRTTHLPYVEPTLKSVRRNIEKYRDLGHLHDLLAPLVPELR